MVVNERARDSISPLKGFFPSAAAPFTGETQSTILTTETTKRIKTTALWRFAHASIIQTFTIFSKNDSSLLFYASQINRADPKSLSNAPVIRNELILLGRIMEQTGIDIAYGIESIERIRPNGTLRKAWLFIAYSKELEHIQ